MQNELINKDKAALVKLFSELKQPPKTTSRKEDERLYDIISQPIP